LLDIDQTPSANEKNFGGPAFFEHRRCQNIGTFVRMSAIRTRL